MVLLQSRAGSLTVYMYIMNTLKLLKLNVLEDW